MGKISFRLARIEDAAAACAVLRRSITELCFPDHNNDPALLEAWLANKTAENVGTWITDPANFVVIATLDGTIVGVAAMTRSGNVTLNYVSPDARFRGVSKGLLAALENKAIELGVSECRLESTKTALNFYRAAGYRDNGAATAGCGNACRPLTKLLRQPVTSR